MTAFVIVLLLFLGIVLLLLEFLVIPGVTVAGIGGVLLMGAGIYLAYFNFGNFVGNITLFSTLAINLFMVVYALRSGTWKKLMLNSNVDSTVESETQEMKPGDTGVTVTRLAPMGKVRVGDKIVEGESVEGYLDPKTEIEVLKVNKYKIIVKPKNK